MKKDPYEDFRRAIEGADESIDLGAAALLMAQSEYPDLDIAAYIGRLDELARDVSRHVGEGSDVYRSIAALNHVLFDKQGFRGNRDAYYDPKNSFLHQVIELKKGIPITLSVLYIEVARRIGLTLQGVGFPGHFLVKYASNTDLLVIDPFYGGEIRTTESLKDLLHQLYGQTVEFHPRLLDGVTKRQILKRMLTNLKVIYLRNQDLAKALSILHQMLIVTPDSAEEFRDRGAIYLKLECFKQARDDFESYLRLAPEAEDAGAVRERLIELAKQVSHIH
jgi:regulator of sirC expression with transglutaminase-like and TPR domain